MVKYIQLKPSAELPDISELNPFRAVVIIDDEVTELWQKQVSKWLVSSGCLYMMAWGNDCKSWDSSVDKANLEEFNYAEIPDDKFVMTTWHDNEPLNSVFWFSKHSAFHNDVEINNDLLLHISENKNEEKLLEEYSCQ